MKIKKGLLILSLVLTTGMMTGCSKDRAFYFDFSRFLQNEITQEEEVKLEGINLKEGIVNKEDILQINKVVDSIFEILANKDYYFNNFNNNANYFNGVRDKLTEDFYTKVSSGEVKSSIKKSIDNIYYNEYTEFKDAKVVLVEKTLDGLTCYVEVVSVNDELLFNTELIALDLDINFKVKGDKHISDMSSETNTTKELGEDSLLQSNHDGFITALDNLFANLKNTKLYNEIISKESPTSEFALDSLINNIKIKNKSNDSLAQLFIAGKGDFSNYAIDSYRIDDYDGMAITTYVVKFSVNGEIQKFEIEYSRILNDIVKVTKRA